MIRLRCFLFIVMLVTIAACVGKTPVQEASLKTNLLSGIRITNLNDGNYSMTLRSMDEVPFNVLYSQNPYKLVIFAPETLMNEEVLRYRFSDTVVQGLAYVPGKDTSKIEVLLNEDVEYEFTQKKNILNIVFRAKNDTKATLEKYGMNVATPDTDSSELASKVVSFRDLSDRSQIKVEVGLNGVARYDYGYLDDKTMYIDIFDVTSSLDKKRYTYQGMVTEVKVNEYYPPKKVRFLLSVTTRKPIFAGLNKNNLTLSSEISAVSSDSNYIASIDALNYRNIQSIIIKFIGKVGYNKQVINDSLYLEFDSDVKLLSGVKNKFTFKSLPFKSVEVLKVDGKTVVVFTPEKDIYARVDETHEGVLVSASFNEFAKANMELSEPTSGKNARNTKPEDLVTLNMKDMDIREAIRLMYYGRAKNVVFGEEVIGKITLYLKDVDYDTALKLILRDRNLTKIEESGIVWITTTQKYEERQLAEAAKMRAAEAAKDLAPLKTEIIPVNFAEAPALTGIIRSILSKRGSVEVEMRTNSFVVRDTQEAINEIKKLMVTVDKRTPQVTIEARIVEVSDLNSLNFGIQWGATMNYSGSTKPTSANFPNTINVGGDSDGYMVNIPTAESVGSFALGMLNRSGTFGLDLALSALESQNKAKTISSPRVTTLDNMEATIKSGRKALIVPSGDDTKTEEIDTGIILKVKPHITSNDMVFLDILVEKSTLGEITSTTATADEKKAETKVLLANGETTVIGGLYEDEEIHFNQGVPGLSRIPVLGHLFKGTQKRTTRKELLVFLTPYVDK